MAKGSDFLFNSLAPGSTSSHLTPKSFSCRVGIWYTVFQQVAEYQYKEVRMVTTTPKAVKLWGRGQLTIPKEVRQALKLDQDGLLSVFVIGRCLVLTPKRLLGPSLAKDVERSMKAKGLSLEDLLTDLKKEREHYNQERYGG